MTSHWKRIFTILLILIVSSCTPPPSMETEQSWAEQTLQELTLRQKISQMLIYSMHLSFRNNENVQWQQITHLVETDGIGGIHLWKGNTGLSVTMLNELQRKSKVPILVDMDIEKGMQQRFPEGTQIPPSMALAASNYLKNAYDAGRIVALEGRSVGVHWNLAPVIDVNNNPDNPIINTRGYSDDPKMVSDFAIAYIKGLRSGGMLSTAKHFPGHGDTQTDSHKSLATIPSDSSRLWSIELAPYKDVIEAGVDAVMISHLIAPDYQPNSNTPATLSKFWIQDILRGKLGFTGAVVTDAMDMGGVANGFSDDYALIEAVNAGSDIIIQKHDYKNAIDVIENAVKEGIVLKQRINESALQILKLKEKVGLNHSKEVNFKTMQRTLGLKESNSAAKNIADQSVVIVKNENNLIPLNILNKSIKVIDFYGSKNKHEQSVATKELIKNRIPLKSYVVDETDSPNYLKTISSYVTSDDVIILNIFARPSSYKGTVGLNENQTKFVNDLIERSKNIIMVSYGNPYLIRDFQDIPAYVCAWEFQSNQQKAGTNAILGKGNFNGKLPIGIPDVAKRGDGINITNSFTPIKSNWKKPAPSLKRVLPYEVSSDVSELNSLLNNAVSDSAFPGGVLLAAKDGKVFINKPFGFHTYSKKIPISRGSILDLASITKVVSTTSAVMKLYDDGKINLNDKVGKYIPEFINKNLSDVSTRKTITINHLLTHTSGLPPFKLFYEIEGDNKDRISAVFSSELETEPGEKYVYSDIGFIILGKIVEKISGQPLDTFVEENIYKPLGMLDTYYTPEEVKMKRIVPTEFSERENDFVIGYVHDKNAHSLGGVSGHAGLFSITSDLAIFAQMLLNDGVYNKIKMFDSSTVELFTSVVDSTFSSRCLGWDSPSGNASGGVYLSDKSFGHTGFTGTSMWIDPKNDIFVILLTNAVHPNREWKSPKYFDWRQKIHSEVYESLGFTQQNPKLTWRKEWNVE